MTVATTASQAVGLGNGATTAWPYTFNIPDAASLTVIYTDAIGVTTTLSPAVYSVTGLGNPAGGVVTYPLSGAPIAAGTKLTIKRIVPLKQNTSLVNQSGFYPNVVEAALDNIEYQIQQVSDFASTIAYSALTTDTPAYIRSVLGVTPEMYGADGTAAGDTAGIQAAVDSGKPIYFQPRVYLLQENGLTHGINVDSTKAIQRWIGAGRGKTILRASAATTWDPIFVNGVTGFHVEGITFDGNGMLTGTSSRLPGYIMMLHISSSQRVNVERCEFIGFYYAGIFLNASQYCRVIGNIINRGTPSSAINQGIAVGGSTSSHHLIADNDVRYCDIGTNGSYHIIRNNEVMGWGFSAGINTQAQTTDHHLIIMGNYCHDSATAPDISPYYMAGIENWANNSLIIGNECSACCGNGIDNGGAYCIIANNLCHDNGTGSLNATGIFLLKQDATFRAIFCTVVGNACYESRGAPNNYQKYGYTEQAGSAPDGNRLSGNNFFNHPSGEVSFDGTLTQAPEVPWRTQTVNLATDGAAFAITPTGTLSWRRDGHTLQWNLVASVAAAGAGTASGAVTFNLPYTILREAAGVCFERNVTGKMGYVRMVGGSTVASMKLYDNTFAGPNNAAIIASGTYEI